MDILTAAERFAALGHESRLNLFRLLVEAGPDGIPAGTLGERLGLPGATLSFHLAHLVRVGLVRGRRDGRFIRYSADFDGIDDLIAFLTRNCCAGATCLPQAAACDTVAKRRAALGGTDGEAK